jgi:hypothetical protein
MNNILDENSISDEDSHYIQNEIEHIIEELKQDPKNEEICKVLLDILDMIPCSCGEEYE